MYLRRSVLASALAPVFFAQLFAQTPAAPVISPHTIEKAAGDQGLVVFNLDSAKTLNLPRPDGFTAVTNLDDGTTVCWLAARKLVGRAMSGGAAPGAAATRLILATGRANTVSAVAYTNHRQVGVIVVRVP